MIELTNAKLFEGLPAKELKALGNEFKTVLKPAGSKLVVTGDSGVGFMIILDGTVEVTTVDGRKRILGQGDYYGEMALLNEGARSATVVAMSDVQLAGLVSWSFKPFLLNHPEVCYRLLQTISQRLREAETR